MVCTRDKALHLRVSGTLKLWTYTLINLVKEQLPLNAAVNRVLRFVT